MDDVASLASSDMLRFERAAIHVFPVAGQDSEALVAFSPSGLASWLASHAASQPWMNRHAALMSLWRQALSRPEALVAAWRAEGIERALSGSWAWDNTRPGGRMAEHNPGRLGNPSAADGALVWHVAMLGQGPADPFDARLAALGLAQLLSPLMGGFEVVSLAPEARIVRRGPDGLATVLPTHQLRADSAFKGALQSAFEAEILSEASSGPTARGARAKRI